MLEFDARLPDETIHRARAGEADAWKRLVELHRPWLKLVAQRELPQNLRNRIDDSDIVQQTCLSAFRNIDDFEGEHTGQFLAWIKQIHMHNVQNVIREHVHAQKRDIRNEQLVETESELDALRRPARSDTPSQRLIYSEKAVLIAAALEKLPEEQRIVIRMRYFEDATVSEIAVQLEKTTNSIGGLMRRGMKSIKIHLEYFKENGDSLGPF